MNPDKNYESFECCPQCKETFLVWSDKTEVPDTVAFCWFDEFGKLPLCSEKCRDEFQSENEWEYYEELEPEQIVKLMHEPLIETYDVKSKRIAASLRDVQRQYNCLRSKEEVHND